MVGKLEETKDGVSSLNYNKREQTGLKTTRDSPGDLVWRWNIVGGGVHLGDNDVGIIGKLQRLLKTC